MRRIKVYSTSFGSGIREVEVENNATWEDLKRVIGISGPNWTGIGRPTKTTYISVEGSSESSALNLDDLQINIFPKQMKAGNYGVNIFRQSNSLTKTSNESLSSQIDDLQESLDELQEKINNLYDKVSDTSDRNKNEVKDSDGFEAALGLG